jgi:hypothetical protein
MSEVVYVSKSHIERQRECGRQLSAALSDRQVSTPQCLSLDTASAERVISAPTIQTAVLPYRSWRQHTTNGQDDGLIVSWITGNPEGDP